MKRANKCFLKKYFFNTIYALLYKCKCIRNLTIISIKPFMTFDNHKRFDKKLITFKHNSENNTI